LNHSIYYAGTVLEISTLENAFLNLNANTVEEGALYLFGILLWLVIGFETISKATVARLCLQWKSSCPPWWQPFRKSWTAIVWPRRFVAS